VSLSLPYRSVKNLDYGLPTTDEYGYPHRTSDKDRGQYFSVKGERGRGKGERKTFNPYPLTFSQNPIPSLKCLTEQYWDRGQMSSDSESYAKELMSRFQYCDRYG
jgi:hypothetical protein